MERPAGRGCIPSDRSTLSLLAHADHIWPAVRPSSSSFGHISSSTTIRPGSTGSDTSIFDAAILRWYTHTQTHESLLSIFRPNRHTPACNRSPLSYSLVFINRLTFSHFRDFDIEPTVLMAFKKARLLTLSRLVKYTSTMYRQWSYRIVALYIDRHSLDIKKDKKERRCDFFGWIFSRCQETR